MKETAKPPTTKAVITHSAKWFAKQEARLEEPLKNTIRYKGKNATLKIFLGLPTLVLPVLGIVELWNLAKDVRETVNFTTDYMRSGRAVTNDGAPGAGKTFTGCNTAYYLSIEAWEQLQEDYATQKAMLPEWLKNGESDKIEAFKAIEKSYKFYKEREATNIPCLVSTIPLREYGTGRMSFVVTPEMFLQIDPVPEYTIFFIDEIGEDQGVDKSDTQNPDYLAFWRFPRHFFDGKFVNTNQDGGQAAIAVRRSTDYVNHIVGQEWKDRPTALINRYKRKKARFFKRLKQGKYSKARAQYIAQELYYLKKYYKTIGFRQVTCQLRTTKGEAVGNLEKFILPAIGGVQYDDRTYRNQYKCKDKPINLRGWEKLTIDEYDHSEFNEQVKTSTKNSKRGAG